MEKTDYKNTLNLPRTAFPMKANLSQREPEIIARWKKEKLYEKICEKNKGKPNFTLHDGPPYANGNIHFGHILNKVLKDIIIKYKSMKGFLSPYIPGWDCHGLPIEHQVDKNLGEKKRQMTIGAIRKECREYAKKFVEIQREEFERLGVLGDWNKPYLTMSHDYEATIAREFGKFVEKGSIYQGKKPVLWCPSCQTALAEAEIEYQDHASPSIYIKFPVVDDLSEISPRLKGAKVSIVIWTTTPWTIPSNLAIALHPNYDYVAAQFGDEVFIVASTLLQPFADAIEKKDPEIIERFSGKRLEYKKCKHPLIDRTSLVVISDYVTMDTGTGCVHIAPGHGQEDFQVGQQYRLETLTPVDHKGKLTEEAMIPELTGTLVFDANTPLIQMLKKKKALLKESQIQHSYPHCWRCKNPVIFRATEQWFISLSHGDLKNKSLDAIRRTEWIPPWGRERIYGMVENRPDWCISRQRLWGVPIIAFKCGSCGEHLLNRKVIDHVADMFEKDGADVWFDKKTEELLPKGTKCSGCGKNEFDKERDILDVWFDSGVSFTVAEKNSSLSFPSDLYLEGSDQHRGWFHSSLLISIGTRGVPPYKAVLTHGFVVDGEGRKYSKSAKNYVPPDKLLKQHGAEIMRLWTAAEDYRNDIRISDEIINRLVEAYRKIRNTSKFLLSNLYDLSPEKKTIHPSALEELNQWILHVLQKLIIKINRAYEEYEFHTIFHELNRFCTVDLSSFYLDILKDCLYCEAADSPRRREAQTIFLEIITTLAKLMAPILSFTADEIWQHIPEFPGKKPSVHLEDFPESNHTYINESLASKWDQLREMRAEVSRALENARQEKIIGNSLDAKILMAVGGDIKGLISSHYTKLPELFITSQVKMSDELVETEHQNEKFPTLFLKVTKAEGQKCERCWNYSTKVGSHSDHPTLCDRCYKVVIKNT